MENDNYKIMVLEDKEENLSAALEGLGSYGTIRSATNYEDGVKVVEEFNPEIAFIDYNFPQEDGGIEEKLGIKFRDYVLTPRYIPNAIVTAGIKKHGDDRFKITEIIPSAKIYVPDGLSWDLDERIEKTSNGITKDTTEAWKDAYRILMTKGMDLYLRAFRIYRGEIDKWEKGM